MEVLALADLGLQPSEALPVAKAKFYRYVNAD
jgi:hypothetical protein